LPLAVEFVLHLVVRSTNTEAVDDGNAAVAGVMGAYSTRTVMDPNTNRASPNDS
jgi:hypothetical protein